MKIVYNDFGETYLHVEGSIHYNPYTESLTDVEGLQESRPYAIGDFLYGWEVLHLTPPFEVKIVTEDLCLEPPGEIVPDRIYQLQS